jgi:hypothetical protein
MEESAPIASLEDLVNILSLDNLVANTHMPLTLNYYVHTWAANTNRKAGWKD